MLRQQVFSVLGMPSFRAVRAGAFSIHAVQKTSAEQTEQNISSVAKQAPANRNVAEMAAFNALGGNVGAAGLALTVLGDNSFDTGTEIGTFVCFERRSEVKDTASAVQSCGKKLMSMIGRTFNPIRADEKSLTARRFIGPVATPSGEKLAQAYVNTDRGTYGILMGNLRRQGEYFNLSSLVERVAPGKLIDELIKAQHNCVSDRRTYSGNVVRITHEKLLVFRKERGSLHFLAKVQQRAQAMQGITWRAAVRRLLQGGKTLHLKEINSQLEAYAATRANNHWEAKIRQVVQDERYFERVAPGTYRLAA